MQLSVSGKFSNDIFDDAYAVTAAFKEAVAEVDFGQVDTTLVSLVYFPVIVSDELGIERKSHRSYSRKEGAEFVNVEIPYERWMEADRVGKLLLLLDGLRVALLETSAMKISDPAKEAIAGRLQTLAGMFSAASSSRH